MYLCKYINALYSISLLVVMGHDNHALVCICREVNAKNNAKNKEINQVFINQITRVYDTARYTTRYRVTETFFSPLLYSNLPPPPCHFFHATML